MEPITKVSKEQQFGEIVEIILHHRSKASRAVNEENLLTAWHVGGYVSAKLKSEEWGSKVVTQLAEYIRSQHPELKGYGRRNIYNMVMFFDEYSSPQFLNVVATYLNKQFVQPKTAQLENLEPTSTVLYPKIALPEIVQMPSAQFPSVLTKTSLSNHIELLETYPDAPVMFKDTLFLDFLGLPQKHSEARLRKGILDHMKQFILELGKDFLFVDQEYTLTVGASTYKADLLFFHRGLQALVAIELKKTKFHPRDLGQLQFYLEALDRDVKRSNENPSIGIILCPEADEVVVEYAMSRNMSPAMVAEYKRVLIPKEHLQQLFKDFCLSFQA